MGRPKNSTRARRINISKTVSHRVHREAEDRAPTEARHGEKASKIIEENVSGISDQEEWVGSSEEELSCASCDSSSIVCLDRGDAEDTRLQMSTQFNMVLFKGLESWQKSTAEKFALTKRPRHYSRHSNSTLYRARVAARKNGQTIDDIFKPVVSPKIQG